MKIVDRILYIEFQELVDAGIHKNTLTIAKHRNSTSWTFIDDPDDNRKVLVEYDSMKEDKKILVRENICGGLDPYQFNAVRLINRQLISKISDAEYFQRQDIRITTRERAIEACKYLYLLERCRSLKQKTETFPMWNPDEFWSYLISHIRSNQLLQEKNGVNLPHARARLNHLAKQYIFSGPIVVLNRRLGNKNSSKLGKTSQSAHFDEKVFSTQLSMLLKLRANPNNLDFSQITTHYNIIARESGWQQLTRTSVMNILKEGSADLVTTPMRRGRRALEDTKAIQLRRTPPSSPLRYVTVDGWDCELAYQELVKDRSGKTHTRYDNRLVVVIILDPWNKYPVGYAIDSSESSALIRRAMKNAIDHVYEITGEYIAPYQVQSDHYALSDLGPYYASIARMHTPASVGNAKSKVIEPYFKYLNKTYCQMLSNWTGFGITARRENQPNRDAKNLMKKSFPDREGVYRQIEEIIHRERQAKGEAYFRALAEGPKRLFQRKDYLLAVGQRKEKTIRATGAGLKLTISGADYYYDTLDIEFRNHLTRNWKVDYDPDDMKSILVSDDDGRISFVLEEKYTQPMAIADQTPEDRRQLQLVAAANRDLMEHINNRSREIHQAVDEHLSSNERLSEFRQKLMFTDSTGQQKDPLQVSKGKMLPSAQQKKALIVSQEALMARAAREEADRKAAEEAEYWRRQEEMWDKNIDPKYLE